MIRIMHVITGLTTGGAEMMLLRLLSANNGDWEPAVVSLMDEGTIGPRIAALGIPVYSLGMGRGRPNPVRALSIVSLTRRFRPHVIVGWMYHGNLMASLAGVFSPTRVPIFWNIQQALDDIGGWGQLTAAVIRAGAILSRHPAAIIYNTQIGAKQHGAFGFEARKGIVIPPGFDCQTFHPDVDARRQFRAENGINEDTVLIGLVARYHPMKDHAGFLRAARIVARIHPNVLFLLLGKGITAEQSALTKLIAELQLESRILLIGERTDTPRITAALDIACSGSAWGEGFSNAVGEAMACGIPCVVTDVGDSAYAVANTGLSVPPGDPDRLAHSLGCLIEAGPEHRRQLGAAARRRIEGEFSLTTIARRYEDLYREHLERFSHGCGPRSAS
jgi:glycosyltransferase involved in cell wall biosynthesis